MSFYPSALHNPPLYRFLSVPLKKVLAKIVHVVFFRGRADPNKEIVDATMDPCSCGSRPRYRRLVAFARSSTARGNATHPRRQRIDHLRAIPRFPVARSGATAGAAGAPTRHPRPYGVRADESRGPQGLLRSAGGDAGG